jgi:hypothetical protein
VLVPARTAASHALTVSVVRAAQLWAVGCGRRFRLRGSPVVALVLTARKSHRGRLLHGLILIGDDYGGTYRRGLNITVLATPTQAWGAAAPTVVDDIVAWGRK